MPKPNEVRDDLIKELNDKFVEEYEDNEMEIHFSTDIEAVADFILERDKKISQVTCPHCWGGHKPPFNYMATCPECQGRGVVVKEGK